MRFNKSLVLIFILVGNTLFAQTCKYKFNGIDKNLNKYVKETQQDRVFGTFFTGALFSAKRIDSNYFFMFDYVLNSYSELPSYLIKPKMKISFKLENEDSVILYTNDTIIGEKIIYAGLPPIYSCNLRKVSYKIHNYEIQKLLQFKTISIRFYRIDSNGNIDYVESEIKKKNRDDIQNLIKCIL